MTVKKTASWDVISGFLFQNYECFVGPSASSFSVEEDRQNVLAKRRHVSVRLHGVVFQKTEFLESDLF